MEEMLLTSQQALVAAAAPHRYYISYQASNYRMEYWVRTHQRHSRNPHTSKLSRQVWNVTLKILLGWLPQMLPVVVVSHGLAVPNGRG
jgi:hypothetical protein